MGYEQRSAMARRSKAPTTPQQPAAAAPAAIASQEALKAFETIKGALGVIEREIGLPHVVSRLQRLDLLRGLTYPEVFRFIDRRFEENLDQKLALADYVAPLIENEGSKPIFIESGSTLGLLSARLSPSLYKDRNWSHVLTNNFLTLTSLEVGRVRVTGGSLELKYLAFLDFTPGRRPSRAHELPSGSRISATDRVVDCHSFRHLNTLISGCDVIYMTASDLGLLIGPLVGDRGNAIFKYCLLNNTARRKIRLCIAFPKLHIGLQSEERCTRHVLSSCYTVMNLGGRRRRPVSTPPDHLGDYRVFINPTKFPDTPATELDEDIRPKDHPRSAPTELGLEEKAGACEGNGLHGLLSSWLDALELLPPKTIELIVGLDPAHAADQADTLQQAVSACNRVLGDLQCQRQYQIVSSGNVVHISVQ